MKPGLVLLFVSCCFLFSLTFAAQAQEQDYSALEAMRASFKEAFDQKTDAADFAQEQRASQAAQEAFWPAGDEKQGPARVLNDSGPDAEQVYEQEPHGTYPFKTTEDPFGFILSFLPLLLSIWVAWDALRIGAKAGNAPGFPDFGPVGWFFLTLCCWCIGFPFYIFKRPAYLAAKRRASAAAGGNAPDREKP